MVTGMDGKEYGPTDLPTLKSWVAENRLAPHTILRDFATGQTMAASAVPGLFSAPNEAGVPPTGMAYPRNGAVQIPTAASGDFGGGAFAWIVVRAILGVVLFFGFRGVGLVVAGSSLYSAYQLKEKGSKWGIPALVVSGVAVLVVGIGWVLRLSGGRA